VNIERQREDRLLADQEARKTTMYLDQGVKGDHAKVPWYLYSDKHRQERWGDEKKNLKGKSSELRSSDCEQDHDDRKRRRKHADKEKERHKDKKSKYDKRSHHHRKEDRNSRTKEYAFMRMLELRIRMKFSDHSSFIFA
jgi:hypothetical protein